MKSPQIRLAIPIGIAIALLTAALWLFLTRDADDPALGPDGELAIEARGIDRAWHFSLAGEDGPDRISVSELAVPLGTEIVIHLHSDDFIYVFSCPDLGLKEIAVPELDHTITFRADEEGQFELAMDPMCGFRLPPGENMGTLRVLPEREFRAWFRRCPTDS